MVLKRFAQSDTIAGQVNEVVSPIPIDVKANALLPAVHWDTDERGLKGQADITFKVYPPGGLEFASGPVQYYAQNGNTDVVVPIDTRDLIGGMAVYLVVGPGGSSNLAVIASADGKHFIVIDSVLNVAPGSPAALQYDSGHIGAAAKLNPLSFRYVNVTATAPGPGNNTTLYIGVK